jgi:hypothetical protein
VNNAFEGWYLVNLYDGGVSASARVMFLGCSFIDLFGKAVCSTLQTIPFVFRGCIFKDGPSRTSIDPVLFQLNAASSITLECCCIQLSSLRTDSLMVSAGTLDIANGDCISTEKTAIKVDFEESGNSEFGCDKCTEGCYIKL